MLKTPKTLAQAYLTGTTLTDVYTAPKTAAEGRVSEIVAIWVCNQTASAVTVRASVAVAGAADTNKQYLVYDYSLPANESIELLQGSVIYLSATDVLRLKAGTGNALSVNVQGVEQS